MPIITLTTDFGAEDGYVAAMKGVILTLLPTATLVDVSHAIAPGAVRQAAYVLSTAAPFFPPDTVHVAVVDPGVGSARRAVAVGTTVGTFVGPDNGLLPACLDFIIEQTDVSVANPQSPVLSLQAYVALTDPSLWRPAPSATFHGRDIFAPVGAYLARGATLERMGVAIEDPVRLPPLATAMEAEGSWRGEVLHVDHFGNLITTLTPASLSVPLRVGEATVAVGGQRIPLKRTFSDVPPGGLVAYIGSSGRVEVAVNGGDAAQALGTGVGAPISVSVES